MSVISSEASWLIFLHAFSHVVNFPPRNFACKGYQQDVPGKSQAVETIKAGQQYEVTLDGSAVHGGGSCQFSLS